MFKYTVLYKSPETKTKFGYENQLIAGLIKCKLFEYLY